MKFRRLIKSWFLLFGDNDAIKYRLMKIEKGVGRASKSIMPLIIEFRQKRPRKKKNWGKISNLFHHFNLKNWVSNSKIPLFTQIKITVLCKLNLSIIASITQIKITVFCIERNILTDMANLHSRRGVIKTRDFILIPVDCIEAPSMLLTVSPA